MATPTRTFRPSKELDDALVETARREDRSIQEVMRTAVEQYVSGRSRRIDELVNEVVREDGPLLDRLGSM